MSLAKAVHEVDFSDESPFAPRSDWTREEIEALFELPFNDLMFRAQETHRAWFNANKVQLSTLLNIKSGACPEDCKYCSQSVRYETEAPVEPLMSVEEVRAAASKAKAAGASRFCMGAAWRQLRDRDVEQVGELIKTVKDLGMESCVTLGMVNERHAKTLKDAGLDYYNHNVDTSEEYYGEVITTRSYQDRLDTLENVRNAGIKVCSGGIVGMGEKRQDRAGMIMTLATQPTHPESVPINMLVPIEGTPMGDVEQIDPIEFVRTVAVARICMPRSVVRLSAGRMKMSQETQTLCYMAGANSIFYGEELLTTGNNDVAEDTALFARLGIEAWNQQEEPSGGCGCSKG